jgi:hypothetical protein
MKDRIHQLLPYQVNAATLKATGNADVKFSLDEAGDLLSGARGTTIETLWYSPRARQFVPGFE